MKEEGHTEVGGQDGHTEVEVRSVEAPRRKYEKKPSSAGGWSLRVKCTLSITPFPHPPSICSSLGPGHAWTVPAPSDLVKSPSLVCYSPKASANVCVEKPLFLLLAWGKKQHECHCWEKVPDWCSCVQGRWSQDISWVFVLIFCFILWEGLIFKDQPILMTVRAVQAPKPKTSSFYKASGTGGR